MNIHVTVDVNLSPSTLDALKMIFGGFSNPVTDRNAIPPASSNGTAKVADIKNSEPKPEVKAPVKTDVTKEDVRAKAAELTQVSAEMKAKVKEAIAKYAEKLTDVPADKYTALLNDLNAIK